MKNVYILWQRELQWRISWRQGRVSTWWNRRWRRNPEGLLGSRRGSEKTYAISEISFNVTPIEPRRFNFSCRGKESHPIPLNNVDFTGQLIQIGDCTKKQIYDYWDVDENEICQRHGLDFTRFTLLNETLLKGVKQTRWQIDEHSDDIPSRSYMAWRIDKNVGKQLKEERK